VMASRNEEGGAAAARWVGLLAASALSCGPDPACDCGFSRWENRDTRWLEACHATVVVEGETIAVEIAKLAPREGCLLPTTARLRLVWDGGDRVVQRTEPSPPRARRLDQRSADTGFGYVYRDALPGRSVEIRPGALWTTIEVVFSSGGRFVPLRCGSDPALTCE
jgi:hypothetical protein